MKRRPISTRWMTIEARKPGGDRKGRADFQRGALLDTPVCDAQTKRFNEEAAQLPGVAIFTISMDLPFAQKRWCGNYGVDKIKMLSDHRSGLFGEQYGTLIKDMRIESRAIFVLDKDDTIKHVEYVKEVADHPNYETALAAARSLAK